MGFLPLIIAIAVLFSRLPASAIVVTGAARIVDGDTLVIDGTRVRLHGIDAPETGQHCRDGSGGDYHCGAAAADVLGHLIGNDPISCAGTETDDYGRLIAVCRRAGNDMNAEMVRRGWALAFLRYSDDYAAAELGAAEDRRGLWAGTFEPPWEFRRSRWQSASREAPRPECPIKGNISGNRRIYHTPFSRDYDRTRVDAARGERWFCSETDALAAGWRAPRH
jgi:endonuclease YncB( thermonuclease family)